MEVTGRRKGRPVYSDDRENVCPNPVNPRGTANEGDIATQDPAQVRNALPVKKRGFLGSGLSPDSGFSQLDRPHEGSDPVGHGPPRDKDSWKERFDRFCRYRVDNPHIHQNPGFQVRDERDRSRYDSNDLFDFHSDEDDRPASVDASDPGVGGNVRNSNHDSSFLEEKNRQLSSASQVINDFLS